MEAPQASKVFKKGKPLGMNQLKWFNLKGKIQNKIRFSYLVDLGVNLI
jgi:hypothetical protein